MTCSFSGYLVGNMNIANRNLVSQHQIFSDEILQSDEKGMKMNDLEAECVS